MKTNLRYFTYKKTKSLIFKSLRLKQKILIAFCVFGLATGLQAQTDYIKRINCGSSTTASYQGNSFQGDMTNPNGVTYDGDRQGTTQYLTLAEPIKSFRFTKNTSGMNYHFDLANGDYEVKLYFAEPWHGIAPGTSPDTRKFHVDIEGGRIATDLNVISAAGGANQVYLLEETTTVIDGKLTIHFAKGSGNDPIINAIEVKGTGTTTPPDPTPDFAKRINCGSSVTTNYQGNSFEGDMTNPAGVTYDGDRQGTTPYLTLAEPIKSFRFTKNTSGMNYHFDVENGNYDVILHFAEPYHGLAPGTSPDTRKFHIDIEGERVVTDLNIISAAGGANQVYVLERETTVNDGQLTIHFAKGSGNDPLINAIEVLSASGTPDPDPDPNPNPVSKLVFTYDGAGNQIKRSPPEIASAAAKAIVDSEMILEEEVEEKEIAALFEDKLTIYPNPTKGNLTMEWQNTANVTVTNIIISDMSGRVIPINYNNQNTVARVDLSNQITGVYLVRFMLNDGSEVVQKIIKQ